MANFIQSRPCCNAKNKRPNNSKIKYYMQIINNAYLIRQEEETDQADNKGNRNSPTKAQPENDFVILTIPVAAQLEL